MLSSLTEDGGRLQRLISVFAGSTSETVSREEMETTMSVLTRKPIFAQLASVSSVIAFVCVCWSTKGTIFSARIAVWLFWGGGWVVGGGFLCWCVTGETVLIPVLFLKLSTVKFVHHGLSHSVCLCFSLSLSLSVCLLLSLSHSLSPSLSLPILMPVSSLLFE